MGLTLTPTQLAALAAAIGLMFIIFMMIIYPKYFQRANAGIVRGSQHRPASIIMDKSIHGGQAIIEAVENINDSGKVVLHMRNRNSSFVKSYSVDELAPLNIVQVMCDTEAPIFITRDIKNLQNESKKEIDAAITLKEEAIARADYYKKEFEALKANKDAQVEKEVQRVLATMQPNKPQWPTR